MTLPGPALAWCPFPDFESAETCVTILLEEGLVACANLLPGMRSHYVWQGTKEVTEEVGVLLKTNSTQLESLVSRLEQVHPYDEPAILGWHCDRAAPATAQWLGALS